MRLSELLVEQRVPFETLLHPPAFTAQKRARFLHVSGRQVAKAVLLHGPEGYFLAVLPATCRVDLGRLQSLLGGPVRLASVREIVEVFVDCEWGVVPPFGRRYGLPVLLDDSIGPDTLVVFETDARAEAVRLRCRDFERLEKARRVRLTA